MRNIHFGETDSLKVLIGLLRILFSETKWRKLNFDYLFRKEKNDNQFINWFCVSYVPLPNETLRTNHHIATLSNPVFILLGTFLHHKSYRRILKVNTNENIENMDVCDFIQGTLQTLTPTPQRTTSYIGHSNQYTRSPFPHTTQL